jgi:hypothetical protein
VSALANSELSDVATHAAEIWNFEFLTEFRRSGSRTHLEKSAIKVENLDDVGRYSVALVVQRYVTMNRASEGVVGADPFDEVINQENVTSVEKHVFHDGRVEYYCVVKV